MLDSQMLKSLKKYPKLDSYNETGDLNENIEHMDNILDYHHTWGAEKYKLFILSLKEALITWFKIVIDNYINF